MPITVLKKKSYDFVGERRAVVSARPSSPHTPALPHATLIAPMGSRGDAHVRRGNTNNVDRDPSRPVSSLAVGGNGLGGGRGLSGFRALIQGEEMWVPNGGGGRGGGSGSAFGDDGRREGGRWDASQQQSWQGVGGLHSGGVAAGQAQGAAVDDARVVRTLVLSNFGDRPAVLEVRTPTPVFIPEVRIIPSDRVRVVILSRRVRRFSLALTLLHWPRCTLYYTEEVPNLSWSWRGATYFLLLLPTAVSVRVRMQGQFFAYADASTKHIFFLRSVFQGGRRYATDSGNPFF